MYIKQAAFSATDSYVLDQLPIALIVGNASGELVYVNPEGMRMCKLYSSTDDFLSAVERSWKERTGRGVRDALRTHRFSFAVSDRRVVQVYMNISTYHAVNAEQLFLMTMNVKEVAEEERMQSVSRIKNLEDILEHIPADVVMFDREGRFLYLNQFAVKDETLRKYLIGKTNIDYCKYRKLDLSLGQRRQDLITKVLESGEPQIFEEELERNGVRSWHSRYMHPVKDEHGEIEYIVGYARNIDRQKQTETFTKIQSMAMEEAVDGIALLDNQSRFFYMNKSHANMYGYDDPAELIGQTWYQLYEDSESNRIVTEHFPQLQKNGTWKGVTQGKRKDGSLIITEITLSIVPDGMICVCRDVTEIRKKEAEMQRLALVASKSRSSVMITDPTGAIEWVNESYENSTGYKLTEIKGKRPYEFLNGPDTSNDQQEVIDECITKGLPFSGDIVSYAKSGKKSWLHLESTPVLNIKGNVQYFICVATDISLLKEAKLNMDLAFQKERELNELKSRFVSLASHEFRTPLASILSSIEIIGAINDKKYRKDERVNVHSERIAVEVQRMTDIMNDILLMGRLEVGRVNLKREKIDLVSFSKDQLEKASFKYLINPFDFQVRGIPQPVDVDVNLLGHVYVNLLSNAVKYSSTATKQPELLLCYKSDSVQLKFKDHGIGIPVKDQPQLFNSFFRASNTNDIQGTGLGLVIVKQFVEMHNGSVQLISEEGNGCEVIVTLPIQSVK